VLNLLQDGAKEVWAVDVNPAQTHLFELKLAGLRTLDHADFLSFMGVRASQRRLDVYDSLRPALSVSARAYFDSKPFLIERGVLYQAVWNALLALRGHRHAPAASPLGASSFRLHRSGGAAAPAAQLARPALAPGGQDHLPSQLLQLLLARAWLLAFPAA